MATLEHVDVPAIQKELVAFCCDASPSAAVRTEDDELAPGFYWPNLRATLKRLRRLLPDDPDIADCDDLRTRDALARLKSLVAEIWSSYKFDDMPADAPGGQPVFEAPEWGRWDYLVSESDVRRVWGVFETLPTIEQQVWAAMLPTPIEAGGEESTGGGVREQANYTIAQVRNFGGVSNETLNKYARRAGLPVAERGKKDFLRSHKDVVLLFQTMLEQAPQVGEREAARIALEKLK